MPLNTLLANSTAICVSRSRRDQRVETWATADNVELAYTPTNSSWLNRSEAQFTAQRYFALPCSWWV